MHKSIVRPKAINRSKITLDLNQFQTLPPKPPTAKPVPPRPKPKPPLPPRPKPKPKALTKPKPKPLKKKPPITAAEKGKKPEATQKNEGLLHREQNLSKKIAVKKIEKKEKPRKKKSITLNVKPVKKFHEKPAKAIPKMKRVEKKAKKAPPRKHVAHRRPRKAVPRHRPRPQGPDSRLISSLYGSSYSRMSSAQRRFIDENLRRILEISQRTLNYLGYPQEAAHFGEQGTNIVQFWLYPNGDIRGLRLRRRIGSPSLDRQTIEVIKTAYMNYPRPKVKTKIIIYVRYRLY